MKTLQTYINQVLNSYAVVFFSQHKLFGFILLAVTFIHPVAGLAALLAVVLSLTVASFTGFNSEVAGQGLYSFNAMLTALGLATMYQHTPYFWFILVLATISTLVWSIILSGWLGKYGLPVLSIPFILTFWMISLADHHLVKNPEVHDNEFWNTTASYITDHLSGLAKTTTTLKSAIAGSNQSALATKSDTVLRSITASDTVTATQSETATATATIENPNLIFIFFKSLSAILFQDSTFTGLLIGLGLLLYSRIAFSLLVIGFCAAYGFEILSGETAATINYYNFGANYMMTAVAIGAFFIIPSKHSYFWAVIGVFFCSIMVKGMSRALVMWDLPLFSLPFSLVSIMMLYFFMQRVRIGKLNLTTLQNYSPELNLYQFENHQSRLLEMQYLPLSLPFMGEWSVSQGYEGGITHKGEWSKALDFVIHDADGNTFGNDGAQPKDYYCYNKPVLACADGFVEDVADDIDDNPIGGNDTVHNWGNSIVIRHGIGLYSKVSHLKKGTLKVKKGDFVYRGDVIAACGSSGRSPEPHLHFQVQATPYIGSKTLEYPISNFITANGGKCRFESFGVPAQGTMVSNAPVDSNLRKAFAFQPGYRLEVNDMESQQNENWEVFTDAYNQSYIYSKTVNSTAYFISNGTAFYFTNFYGDKNSLLYQFYLAAYHIILSTADGVKVEDAYPLSHSQFKQLLWLQDFAAPFYHFISLTYHCKLRIAESQSETIYIDATQQISYPGKNKNLMNAQITVTDGAVQTISIQRGDKKTEILCNTANI